LDDLSGRLAAIHEQLDQRPTSASLSPSASPPRRP